MHVECGIKLQLGVHMTGWRFRSKISECPRTHLQESKDRSTNSTTTTLSDVYLPSFTITWQSVLQEYFFGLVFSFLKSGVDVRLNSLLCCFHATLLIQLNCFMFLKRREITSVWVLSFNHILTVLSLSFSPMLPFPFYLLQNFLFPKYCS